MGDFCILHCLFPIRVSLFMFPPHFCSYWLLPYTLKIVLHALDNLICTDPPSPTNRLGAPPPCPAVPPMIIEFLSMRWRVPS